MCGKLEKNKKNKGKMIVAVAFTIIVIAGAILYYKAFSPSFNIKETVYVYVDDRKDFNDLLMQLQSTGKIKDVRIFRQAAQALGYPNKMKTGRYAITPETSCKDLLENLIRGTQSPCKITFNNLRLKDDLVNSLGSQFMFGVGGLSQKLNDPQVCASYGFDEKTIVCMFIPNTYEMYWNIPVDRFLERMKKEYDRFWSQERLGKAKAIPLSPVQVSILASIVEEETIAQSEYPIVAGLYINRLKIGMLLQADPTVKYAVGDFSIKRILYTHLEVESPYNTYKYLGLPPGPIRVPSINGIDGVLNYAKHNYLYMCAKEDFSGKHNFAATMAEHTRNAELYRKALNRNNIR